MTRRRVPVAEVRQVEASLRFDADPVAVAAYLVRLIIGLQAHVLRTTEAQQPGVIPKLRHRLAGALRRRAHARKVAKVLDPLTGDRYRVRRRGEFLLVWDVREFPQPVGRLSLTRYTRIPGLPDWRNTRVARQNLRHRAGLLWALLWFHAPAGVEHGDGWKGGAQTRAAQAFWPRLGRVGRRILRRAKVVLSMAGDGNLDARRPSWRAYWRGVVRVPLVSPTDQGTHGHRAIDVAFVDGGEGVEVDVVEERVVTGYDRPGKLDHEPIFWIERVFLLAA